MYILKSSQTGKFYKGFSKNLKQRIQEHKRGIVKTTYNQNYKLVFYCAFQEKTKALHFEKYLKHGSGFAFAKKHFLE